MLVGIKLLAQWQFLLDRITANHLFAGHEPEPDVCPLLRQQDARGRIHLEILWGRLLFHLPADVQRDVLGDLWEGGGKVRSREV